ncbi:hypothetical protein ABZ896_14275 [Streptomyces sp. NPDC047072]|uniref:hypothetical protein n=1 Tax=Streptomyces sp. NPDC047072 TaxID=3154809 RepID=UPI0033C9553E
MDDSLSRLPSSPAPVPRERQCRAPVGDPDAGQVCGAAARFEIGRHIDHPLRVCAVHLGPSLLWARNVLWPPEIALFRQPRV